jgi:hypothetical protein
MLDSVVWSFVRQQHGKASTLLVESRTLPARCGQNYWRFQPISRHLPDLTNERRHPSPLAKAEIRETDKKETAK